MTEFKGNQLKKVTGKKFNIAVSFRPSTQRLRQVLCLCFASSYALCRLVVTHITQASDTRYSIFNRSSPLRMLQALLSSKCDFLHYCSMYFNHNLANFVASRQRFLVDDFRILILILQNLPDESFKIPNFLDKSYLTNNSFLTITCLF